MALNLPNAGPIIVIDLGTIHTRASYYDMVEGQYRLTAASQVPSTTLSPHFDVYKGVLQAFQAVQPLPGESYPDDQPQPQMDLSLAGNKPVRVVATCSMYPSIRVMLSGLHPDGSIQIASKLVSQNYGEIVHQVDLHHHPTPEGLLDKIDEVKPDLLVFAGGSNQGSYRSLQRSLDLFNLVWSILPEDRRPGVLYAGNNALAQRILETLSMQAKTKKAANLLPEFGVEDLNPAQGSMNRIVADHRRIHLNGFGKICDVSIVEPASTAHCFNRMIRFISQLNPSSKGVLGLDIGASSTTLAAAFSGRSIMQTLPIGMGEPVAAYAGREDIGGVMQWLSQKIPVREVEDYIWQKKIHPWTIPSSKHNIDIEQAIARQIIRKAREVLPAEKDPCESPYEPIIVSGAILTSGLSERQNIMLLLDGFEPSGVTTFILDRQGIISGLGAIAEADQVVPVQVLDSDVLVGFATVISPVSPVPGGFPIMNVGCEYVDGKVEQFGIKKGTITRIKIPPGETAILHMETYYLTKLGNSGEKKISIQVAGSVLGAVIDARGRPLSLPSLGFHRRHLLKRWSRSLAD